MGCVRNGFNDGVSADTIIPFEYDEGGYCRFTAAAATSTGLGLLLANGTGTTDLEYTLVIGNSAAATLPVVATRVKFSGYRAAYGFEMYYRSVATSENNAMVTTCYHPSNAPTLYGTLHLEAPMLSGYKVVVSAGSYSTVRQINLAGFLDHHL
jgi:hypothetical protein